MDTTPEEEILKKHTGLFYLRLPEVYRTAVLDAMREYGELKQSPQWQLCPKCNGGGYAMNMDKQIPTTTDICDVCEGKKIIKTPSESPKNRLGEVVGKWPGDEPLEETIKGVSESPKEEACDLTISDYQRAMERGIDTNRELRERIVYLESQEYKDEIISKYQKQYGHSAEGD